MTLPHLLASAEIVRKVDDAFAWIFGISLFFLVLVTIVMIVFVVKYSRKRNPNPADIHGNTKLEITWIVIPTILVVFMFYKGYQGFYEMRHPPADAKVVVVEARRWAFSFTYPDEGVTTSELYVPINTPIRLKLTTPIDDVVHSFYIPDFRTKEDCVPGYENMMWFEADKVGVHNIFCAEFCGKDHAKMLSKVIVLEKDAFESWMDDRVKERYAPIVLEVAIDPASEEIQKRDAKRLYETYCTSCHGSKGRGGLVEGARNFNDVTKWKNGPGITGIFKTLAEGIEDSQMRPFTNLSAWDRFALAHYVRAFSEGEERKESTQEELEALVAEYKLDKQQVVARSFPIDEAMKLEAEDSEAEDRTKR